MITKPVIKITQEMERGIKKYSKRTGLPYQILNNYIILNGIEYTVLIDNSKYIVIGCDDSSFKKIILYKEFPLKNKINNLMGL